MIRSPLRGFVKDIHILRQAVASNPNKINSFLTTEISNTHKSIISESECSGYNLLRRNVVDIRNIYALTYSGSAKGPYDEYGMK